MMHIFCKIIIDILNMSQNIILYGRSISGETIGVPVIFETSTVDDLKNYITEQKNIAKDDLRIILCGISLQNNKSLKETNILKHPCFHWVVVGR